MKHINTLVEDIYKVIDTNGGWDSTVTKFFAERVADTVKRRLEDEPEEGRPTLRMSNLGSPCRRKLWYQVNESTSAEPLRPNERLKFLYGDLLEDLLISLAIAAGHEVSGLQTTMEIDGIKGHRDCVIDGVTVDVKSASSFSFKKFKEHGLREDDPFGYIEQLSSYVYAAKDDPLVTNKFEGAFLVIDKQHGHIVLDKYNFAKEIINKQAKVREVKTVVGLPSPPPRDFSDEPMGKSGNMKLCTQCSYCAFKDKCWPEVKTYIYSTGPVYLTRVVKEPKVNESS